MQRSWLDSLSAQSEESDNEAESRARAGMASEQIIDRALLAVRVLLAIVFFGSLAVEGTDRLREISTSVLVVAGLVLVYVLAVNLLSFHGRQKLQHLRGLLGIQQIAADVTLALLVMFSLDAESTPLAWVALMLPVTTGWNRFSAKGAGGAWLAASISYVALGLRLGTASATETSGTLYLAYQQLFAVLLIAVPALYLGTHFRKEIEAALRAHGEAEKRAEQLHQVTVAARTMSSENQAEVYESLLQATQRIGFSGADIVVRESSGVWQIERSISATQRVAPAALLCDEVANFGETVALDQSSGPSMIQMLHDHGYGSAVAVLVADTGGGAETLDVVLRVWSSLPRIIEHESVVVVEALAAQAAVSLASAAVFQEVRERSQALAYQANHDVLTGLPNRLNVISRIDQLIAQHDPLTETLALLFLDLDGFKAANDKFGHEAGDQVLRVVAQRLQSITPRTGIVARLGGDEFVVVVLGPPGAGAPEPLASAVCERIKEPISVPGGVAAIRASVGVTVYEAGVSRDILLDRADVCMYLAKRAGGDRYEVFDGSQSLNRADAAL